MGDRAHVKIVDGSYNPLYLYTHWGASTIVNDVYDALKLRERWNDSSYLARIIFDRMKKGDIDSTISFGISTFKPDGWVNIVVNTTDSEVSFCGCNDDPIVVSFDDFVSNKLVLMNILNAVYKEGNDE